AVDQQSVAGRDLARSIDLAARSTDEVSAHMGQFRETSLATGSAASQVLNSATELEGQAGALKTRVDEFLNNIRTA
ncbi:MAG TPA: methyl-accepting chemotaxis receptor/sensory transducer, partial [Erythrobacter sp.]|nr:methyl-accepting chemotaxis receptor/sensory transducer [Erythrobacter sp.]